MRIRSTGRGDVGAIAGLSSGLFAEDGGVRDPYINTSWPEMEGEGYFGAVIPDGRSLCLVAEEGGEIVGYLVGRSKDANSLRTVRVAELESMYVQGKFRGRGVGSSLVGEFLRWAEECGAGVSSVTAYAENEGAIRFYRRHGFVPKSVSLERGSVPFGDAQTSSSPPKEGCG